MNILLALAVAPVALILWFITKKDTHPEPPAVMRKIFLFGCLSVIPAVILELCASIFFDESQALTVGEVFVDIFFGVALIEELVKWFVVKKWAFSHNAFDETYDAIVYSVLSSLGFACVENILYVLDGGIVTGIMRAVTSIPGHACFGVMMGYFIAAAKMKQIKGKNASTELFMALLMPTIIHCVYDSLLSLDVVSDTAGTIGVLLWLGFIVAQFVCCLLMVIGMSKKNTQLNGSSNQAN